jgi:ubiquinone/menaquinone biosynthesis C-methylase UbiE
MMESKKNKLDDRLYFIDTQTIDLNNLEITGSILDIGGGGEGIIGQIFGENVVAIDPSKRELEGAADGPLKIVMDARDLKFLDATFDNVTSFFTMMYIPLNDHEKVVREIYRVLKPGGEFYLWDVTIPKIYDIEKEFYVIPLLVKLDGKEIKTGYGTKWRDREQDVSYYINLCKQVGFEVMFKKIENETFHIKLKKK